VGVGLEGTGYTVDTVDDLRGDGNAFGFGLVCCGWEWFYDAEGELIGAGENIGKGLGLAGYHSNRRSGGPDVE
jgi:hypothetical protein